MTDGLLDDCERYWRAAGISRRRAAEMRAELAGHLDDAAANGATAEDVIGPDVAAFARSWAEAQRPDADLPRWEAAVRHRSNVRVLGTWVAILIGVATAASVAVARSDEGSSSVDDSTWIWIWLIATLVLAFAEIVTAGFFMLPFAGGAVVAFVLAVFGVAPAIQLIVFIVVSVLALIWLQRYVKKEDEVAPRVGANRLIDQHAVVLEPIDRATGGGRVRMETELWRATTDGPPIPVGTEVRVVDVRGARLVVVTVE
ncbi:MAG: NfeD family protein [Acidimicrobiia bacterium]|nr:NfeD family protein [Acidimicrobiia bacterium]